jgi:hypothetical protein
MEVNKDIIKKLFKDIIDRITNLEDQYKILISIEEKLTNIETLLKDIDSNKLTQVVNNTSPLVNFDRDAISSMYKLVQDDWCKSFLDNILSSNYDTLTQKQFSKVNEIANKVGYTGPIAK